MNTFINTQEPFQLQVSWDDDNVHYTLNKDDGDVINMTETEAKQLVSFLTEAIGA